jgi:translocation and assembly module TamB
VDPDGNKATVTGSIDIKNLFHPELDMHLKADNWHALHSTAKDNPLFYGELYITADVRIKGPATNPNAEGTVNVLKNTKLTIVNPEQTPAAASPEGIVEFVNANDTTQKSERTNVLDTARFVKVKPKNGIKLNVTATPDAEIIVIVDQGTGDYVSARANAKLEMTIKPDGNIDMYGIATVSSGHYQMNYNFIKRRFVLQKGGTVTFNGDMVKNTSLDVTAIYEANIPPYDLLSRQLSDPGELVYFKQRLPFNVSVHATGSMMLPTLKFDIDLPENKVYPIAPDNLDLVQAKLAQLRSDTSEMNKQVFAVLIFNHFLSDDGFRSSASRSVTSVAMQSVSAFIENELNSATGNLIKGIDLSVDLASTDDYTTGSLRRRTDLSVSASKRLMNDRLKLTVGNNFELEGPQTSNNRNSAVPSNVAADYLLTGDGRYTMRVYHTNYDAGVLQGYVQENGVTLIMSRDYNRFKQIFMRRPRRPQNSTGTDRTNRKY